MHILINYQTLQNYAHIHIQDAKLFTHTRLF